MLTALKGTNEMKLDGVVQTRFGKGEGNCMNACVATLLNVPLEQVDVVWNETNWLQQLNDVIHPLGYCFTEWEFDTSNHIWPWMGECLVIATGDGPRGLMHAVIMRHFIDKDDRHCLENVFDPHPEGRFLNNVKYVGIFFPHYMRKTEVKRD